MNKPLSVEAAYSLWAPNYEVENPITTLDEEAVAALSPDPRGLRMLDVGCGTGRRLPSSNVPGIAVGVDLVPAMLAQGKRQHPGRRLAAANALRLPVANGAFELLWCRLMIGHIQNLDAAYAEFARVLAPRASFVITDFHPEAHQRGWSRSFTDADGESHEVIHYLHTLEDHQRAASSIGLKVEQVYEGRVGDSVKQFYTATNKLEAYEQSLGFPVVLALRLGKNEVTSLKLGPRGVKKFS